MTLVVKEVFDYTHAVTDLNAKLNLWAKSNDFAKGFDMIILLIHIFTNVTYGFNVHHENWCKEVLRRIKILKEKQLFLFET